MAQEHTAAFCTAADVFPVVLLTNRKFMGFLQGSSYSLLHRGRTIRHIQVTPKGLAIADQEIYLTAPRLTLKYLEGNMQ